LAGTTAELNVNTTGLEGDTPVPPLAGTDESVTAWVFIRESPPIRMSKVQTPASRTRGNKSAFMDKNWVEGIYDRSGKHVNQIDVFGPR
jgi:hypothetical protein